MSKTILYIAASLDGYIADADGEISWLDPYNAVDYGYDAFFAGIGALVVGRTTYEQSLSFPQWPYQDRKTFVVSRQDIAVPPGADVERATGDLRAIARRALEAADGKDVWLVGGGKLVTGFLSAQLIDEIRLFVIPVTLGEGIPLFPAGTPPTRWKATASRVFGNGMAELILLPA